MPSGASIRAWVDDLELTVVNWHSAAWVGVWSNDTLTSTWSQVTATVEITVPNDGVRTLVSPPVWVQEFAE